ncbi:hypothetical protein [Kitasatospora sp. NPDC088783]|uniref:hypothetical protein n=1 Tax=Kitasatospora sp. NPDC088783 TaxID=3364077 RepID=UPI0037F487D8
MNDLEILNGILAAPLPACDLAYTGCEGTAVERIPHPTGEALGEEGWLDVWVCGGNCAWQAAREA